MYDCIFIIDNWFYLKFYIYCAEEALVRDDEKSVVNEADCPWKSPAA